MTDSYKDGSLGSKPKQRTMKVNKLENNSSIVRKQRRNLLGCSYCPPHGGENKTRYGKHGKTKRKYKQHRRL